MWSVSWSNSTLELSMSYHLFWMVDTISSRFHSDMHHLLWCLNAKTNTSFCPKKLFTWPWISAFWWYSVSTLQSAAPILVLCKMLISHRPVMIWFEKSSPSFEKSKESDKIINHQCLRICSSVNLLVSLLTKSSLITDCCPLHVSSFIAYYTNLTINLSWCHIFHI